MQSTDILSQIFAHVNDGATYKSIIFSCKQFKYVMETRFPRKKGQFRNDLWTLVLERPDAPWNWFNLSANVCTTRHIILEHPNLPWDAQGLSLNPNLSWDIIERWPYANWDWYYISGNPGITWDDIRAHPYRPGALNTITDYLTKASYEYWNWGQITKNPNISWAIICGNPRYPWPGVYHKMIIDPSLDIETVWKVFQSNRRWLYRLGVSPENIWKVVKTNPQHGWDYNILSNYVNWDIVQANPDIPWNFAWLSENPHITWDIIASNPSAPWHRQIIINNPNFFWDKRKIDKIFPGELTAYFDFVSWCDGVDFDIFQWDLWHISSSIVLMYEDIIETNYPWDYGGLSANTFRRAKKCP